MKLGRIDLDGSIRAAVISDHHVEPLAEDVDIVHLLSLPAAERDRVVAESADGPKLALADVRFRAPIDPPTVRDFLTFEEHLEGSLALLGASAPPSVWYEMPLFYFSNSNAMTGPDDPVSIPPGCTRFDFELELAVVIGRAGSDLTPEQAREHVGGYTLLNDWSARDLMEPVIPFGMGPVKGKDSANSIGPWIVTPDELAPFHRDGRLALEMHVELNGTPLPAGGDNSVNMVWSFEEMIAFASRGTTLRPGDILASGTCGGGCLLEYWAHLDTTQVPPLAAGDVVTLFAEGIGSMTNTVVAGVDPVPVGPARVGQQRRSRSWEAIEGR